MQEEETETRDRDGDKEGERHTGRERERNRVETATLGILGIKVGSLLQLGASDSYNCVVFIQFLP